MKAILPKFPSNTVYEGGFTRIKQAFLLFPRSIKGDWRWLERAKWEEHLVVHSQTEPPMWEGLQWIDELEEAADEQ